MENDKNRTVLVDGVLYPACLTCGQPAQIGEDIQLCAPCCFGEASSAEDYDPILAEAINRSYR